MLTNTNTVSMKVAFFLKPCLSIDYSVYLMNSKSDNQRVEAGPREKERQAGLERCKETTQREGCT